MSGKKGPASTKADILIVEDSLTQAEMLRFVLEEQGYRVTLGRDGNQALACLNGYQPALIISDIIMSEMDGYELCRRIKTDESTRAIQVILLTYLNEAESVMKGLACGADSFITKPYGADYFLGQVEHALSYGNLPINGSHSVELEIAVAGKPQLIRANPQRIVSLLLSIYEAAVHRSTELLQSQDDPKSLNDHLEEQVEQRTAALSAEIVEREYLQAELSELSLRDGLTSLYNRRGFMTLAEQHWRLALRIRQDFAILYMDLDGLKQINDKFGHATGDMALQAVARAMERSFRDSDILARLGGDEFAVLFADCDKSSGKKALNRLEQNLSLAKAEGKDLTTLSLSIGLAQFDPDNKVGINDLLAQADADMYLQKKRANERRPE
jgi:diguanylate cyclase (GGDEF)-like protein